MKLNTNFFFGTPTWILHLITLLCAYYTLERTQFSWIDRAANWWVPDFTTLSPLLWGVFLAFPLLPLLPLSTPFGVWLYPFLAWVVKLAYNRVKRPDLKTHPAAFACRWLFLPAVFCLTLALVHYKAYFKYSFSRSLPAMNAAAQEIMTAKAPYPDRRLGAFNATRITKIGSGFTFQSRREAVFLSHYEYGFSYFPDNKVPAAEKFPRFFGESHPVPPHIHLFGPWYIWKDRINDL